MKRVLVGLMIVPWTAMAEAPARSAKVASRATGYAANVLKWHAATPGKGPALGSDGRPLLRLYALNTGEQITLAPTTARGGFAARDLDRAAHALREPGSGNEHPVEPRLLDIVYRLQVAFDAEEVRVVSGYRTPRGRGSNHGCGRAIDFVLPGAKDEDVAKAARELGFVGVGVYPKSGFLHVDVRPRSYFWIDASGPRRKNRERGILPDLAQRADAAARTRGDVPPSPFLVGHDIAAALDARNAVTTAPDAVDEDTEQAEETGLLP